MEHKTHAEKENKKRPDNRVLMVAAALVLVVGGALAGSAYWAVTRQYVYIEKAQIEAPVANLAPSVGGTLRALYVSAGDTVAPNTVVAQVGVELIKSAQGGTVLQTIGDVGKSITSGQTVVETIDPRQLRVVGQVQEDKGLADIKVGQPVYFTVDAFGSREFTGIVDEVSPTASSGDVVFSVSDKREEQDFDVKVRYDVAAYPELHQGMSAKIWVYRK